MEVIDFPPDFFLPILPRQLTRLGTDVFGSKTREFCKEVTESPSNSQNATRFLRGNVRKSVCFSKDGKSWPVQSNPSTTKKWRGSWTTTWRCLFFRLQKTKEELKKSQRPLGSGRCFFRKVSAFGILGYWLTWKPGKGDSFWKSSFSGSMWHFGDATTCFLSVAFEKTFEDLETWMLLGNLMWYRFYDVHVGVSIPRKRPKGPKCSVGTS